MKRKILAMGKRCVASFLALTLLAQSVGPMQAKAEESDNYLPIATMPEEIESAETFYVGTTSADLEENAQRPYLLKIGRGGLAAGEASVVLKMSDATAKYGKDYKIRLHSDGNAEAQNPEDNKSLLEMINENEVLEDVQLTDEEMAAAQQENLEALQKGAEEYAQMLAEENKEDGAAAEGESQEDGAAAEDGNKEEGSAAEGESQEDGAAAEGENREDGAAAPEEGESQKEGKGQKEADAQKAGEAKEAESDEEAFVKEGNNINNPLAQAKETLTGVASDRETVTSTQQSMVDVLSDTGNYLTQVMPGATLTVDFASGEKEKYVELIPIDNDESDGDRAFYVTLSEPSEGMTNSSVSESIFTIKDDEPEVNASVSFAGAEFTAEAGSGSVEVVLERTGAMTQMVSVHMTSEAGSAVSGQDFSPVDADVMFPFGITERRIKITVDSQHLTKDADFTLKIADGSGASVSENSQARVVIKAGAKDGADKQDAKGKKAEEKDEVSTQASLSDIKYGDYIDLHQAAWKVRGNADYGVNNDGPKGRIYSPASKSWIDLAIALSGDRYKAATQYIYDGFRFSWRKYSKKTCYSSANVAYYRQNETSDVRKFTDLNDVPRFGWREEEYYFGAADAASVKFFNTNTGGKQATMDIDWVKPVLRPFKVELAAANNLSYLNGSGDSTTANGNAVKSTLLDASGGYAVKYAGDNIVIKADNALLGISQLSGVEIVNTHSGKSDTKRIDTAAFCEGFKVGDSQIQVKLNNDFCTTYGITSG